jgi:hypothetical protein
MRKMSKRATMISAGVATAAVVTAGTVAYAAFNSTANADAGEHGAETFAPLTVTGTWLGVRPNHTNPAVSQNLLPGESADVKIRLTNPSTNTVQGNVVSIIPVALVDGQPTGTTNPGYCKPLIKFAAYTPAGGSAITLSRGQAVDVELYNAVTLDASTNETCSGIKFPTNFTVKFLATRDAAHTVPALAPDAS